MSAEQRCTATQDQQSERVRKFHPNKPEIPSDGMCLDDGCRNSTPPLPAGSEPFCCDSNSNSMLYLTAIAGAAVLFIILTTTLPRRSRFS
jgi:hypothetical protein